MQDGPCDGLGPAAKGTKISQSQSNMKGPNGEPVYLCPPLAMTPVPYCGDGTSAVAKKYCECKPGEYLSVQRHQASRLWSLKLTPLYTGMNVADEGTQWCKVRQIHVKSNTGSAAVVKVVCHKGCGLLANNTGVRWLATPSQDVNSTLSRPYVSPQGATHSPR